MLSAAHAAARLNFFGDDAHLGDAQAFAAVLAPLRNTEWVIYSSGAARRAAVARTNHDQLLMTTVASPSRKAHLWRRFLTGHGAARPETQLARRSNRSSSINAAVFARPNPFRHRTCVDSCPPLPPRNSHGALATCKSP